MDILQPFCDWLTVRQTHDIAHSPVFGALLHVTENTPENANYIVYKHKIFAGHKFSNVLIKSDGKTVEFSGNISSFNRPENVRGYSLDQCKKAVNQLLQSISLPEFTEGETITSADGESIYTGATFSRIDITQNYQTGSKQNCHDYLSWIQSQEYPKLRKETYCSTTYFHGKDSRTFRIYDKGEQLKTKIKKVKGRYKKYLTDLSDDLISRGIIRIEIEYKRFLRSHNLRKWNYATTSNLNAQFKKDIKPMVKELKKEDLDDIPFTIVGTLLAYMAGFDVKKRLSNATYYKHKKVLLEYGYDISNRNLTRIKLPQKTIVLRVAEMPDWYEQSSTPDLKIVE